MVDLRGYLEIRDERELLQSRARIERVYIGSPIVRSLEILKIENGGGQILLAGAGNLHCNVQYRQVVTTQYCAA